MSARYDARMRRSAFLAISLLTAAFVFLPAAAHATGLPFYGPIIPLGVQQTCAGNWGGLVAVLNNIIAFSVSIAITFVAPLSIAYAGFLYVTNAFNPSGLARAKTILQNTVLGIVIALAGWLIVDLFLVALTKQGVDGWTHAMFSTSGTVCLPDYSNPTSTGEPTALGTNGASLSGASNERCAAGNTACSPEALMAAGLTAAQANIMSCIAVTESSGNPAKPPYNLSHPGSNSTACGTFQIVQTTWKGAASGQCSDFSNCQNAACNIQVMTTLVSQSNYTSWTCQGCNPKAQACVNQYSNS